jgi:hypothetical protein
MLDLMLELAALIDEAGQWYGEAAIGRSTQVHRDQVSALVHFGVRGQSLSRVDVRLD